MNIIYWVLLLYICYKIMASMDISKFSKFFIFMIIALFPIGISFILFNIKPLNDFEIIKLFYPKSLIVVCVFYTVIVLSVKLFSYILVDNIFQSIKTNVFNLEWETLLYISIIDMLIYSIIPIAITKIQGGTIINLFWNTFFVYLFSIFIIVSLLIRKIKL